MKKAIFGGVALLALVLVCRVVMADDPKDPKDAPKAFNGYIVDVMCAADMVGQKDPQDAAAKHPKSCAIKCAPSGYGIMCEGKFVKFDDAGNKLATDYLANDDNGTQVQVLGTMKDDTLVVKSINAAVAK